MSLVAHDFYKIRKMPKIVGAIEGTHVGIINPNKDDATFFNRKNFTSLNVLASICYIL